MKIITKCIDWGFSLLNRYVVLRYLISGGTAGVTDLVILYLLNSFFGMHYLLSAILAFILAFCVSFTAHKFWTFKSHEESTHYQVVLYMGTSLFGLFLNTLLMYIFVDHFHLKVILSQIIVGFMVASVTFFISRNIVFKYQPKQPIS
jgi:putative flippase GtrA